MPTENASYIGELDPARPGSDELRSEGDDHLRKIKETITNTFVGQPEDPYDKPVLVGPNTLNALLQTPDDGNPGLGADYVTIATQQTITGQKTFSDTVEHAGGTTINGNASTTVFNGGQGFGNIDQRTTIGASSKDELWAAYPGSFARIIHQGNAADWLKDLVVPVGTIVMKALNQSPASTWPGTTWELYATSTDPNIYYFRRVHS